jgi:hypothetical protein
MRALVSSEENRLWLGDAPMAEGDGNDWIAQPGELDDVSARSLEVALTRLRERDLSDYGPPTRQGRNPATGEWISIPEGPRTYEVWVAEFEFDDLDYAVRGPIRLLLRDAGLRLRIASPWGSEAEELDERSLERLVKPMCEALDVPITVTSEASHDGRPEVELAPSCQRRDIGVLLRLAAEVYELIVATIGGALTPETGRDLIRGGFPAALVGQAETRWLDAKREPPANDLEFAKDVAAMANTGQAGLLVYGFSNRKTQNGDEIAGLMPFHRKAMRPPALQKHLLKVVRPRPMGVEIEVVNVAPGQSVGYVYVPAHDPARLPLMFNGVRIGGKVRESFVAIPVRVGEETYWEDATTLHGLLAAGRAALHGSASPS